ncbi:MAG: UDP-N-acetylmuramoyl-L-alanyl-D-glutamate--2,6-diaminopimelate ligase [Eubacteriales bacterium]|nr:UDP-N-acetylmuramoyl-L-alanyl-D-glutamate--2,6-diaminopimelate ligase [Eubacteriales bacterium]
MITTHDVERILKEHGLLRRADKNEKAELIQWVTCDSREVIPGTLFICKGAEFLPEYLLEAVACGCIGYMSEERRGTPKQVRGFIVKDIRMAMAVISAAYFEYEPGKPKLTGVTGTKGKTSTAWYLKAMLDEWQKEKGGRETGLISSVENFDGNKKMDAVMTTPEAPVLHEIIAKVKESGSEYMTIETSSQALKYHRVAGLHFEVGIFLNISEDHISPHEHRDFEDYFNAKLSIFRQCGTACVNLDSDHARRILKEAEKSKRVVTFGQHPEAQVRYNILHEKDGKLTFMVTCPQFTEQFSLKMRGSFNIENAVAAITAAYVYGVPVRCMKKALEETSVPGRMEVFVSPDQKICVIVDYAHNQLSFQKLFQTVFQEYRSFQKIITVFGCPGGKAFNRRKELGALAGMFSDHVYLTSDDPGIESGLKIASEIGNYVEMAGGTWNSVTDRRTAIRCAMEEARTDKEKTLVLVLGRGSEKFQKIGRRLYAYPSDSNIVREMMANY